MRHSFVESPTRGDNIYRFSVEVGEAHEACVDLPDYWPYLNENPQVWVSPKGHYGCGHGTVTGAGKTLTVFTNTPGTYNVLLVGTRCDEVAKANFDPLGVEYVIASAD